MSRKVGELRSKEEQETYKHLHDAFDTLKTQFLQDYTQVTKHHAPTEDSVSAMRQVCMEHINNCSVTLSNELSKLTTEREPTQTRWENIAKEIKFLS